MARILIEEQHAEKRNEILDVAQRLVYTRGYEQMSIQEIINEMQISKGAFYHYFGSKQKLLEALITRTLDQSQQFLLPVVEDPHLPALEKLNVFFSSAGQWKIEQKAYLLALLNIWYADDNAIVRQKTQAETIRRIAPMLTRIVRQGKEEGVFHTPFPDQAGEMILSLLVGFGEIIAAQMVELGLGDLHPVHEDGPTRAEGLKNVQTIIAANTCAMERILGAPTGSIALTGPGVLEDWFEEPPPPPPPVPAAASVTGG